jgi:hypothetical protein
MGLHLLFFFVKSPAISNILNITSVKNSFYDKVCPCIIVYFFKVHAKNILFSKTGLTFYSEFIMFMNFSKNKTYFSKKYLLPSLYTYGFAICFGSKFWCIITLYASNTSAKTSSMDYFLARL